MGIIPPNEYERLSAVRRYDILDTPPDGAFDRITGIAARIFHVPISIVSIVDHDRIWFKSHHGVEVSEIPRDPGLCASAILGSDPWILENAATDIRSLANPLVAGEFGLRFYAGVPLRTHDGFNLGMLCVIDREPRTVTEDEIRILSDLAAVVMDEMELRRAARHAVAQREEEIAERKRIEAQQQILIHELNHRVKNTLATIQAIASQTGRTCTNPSEFVVRFNGRIAALCRAHDLLTAGGWDGGSLRDLAMLSLGAYRYEDSERISLSGPALTLSPKAALSLNMVLYELATNAAKYGALSTPEGRVHVEWRLQRTKRGTVAQIDWREEGGPPIEAPPQRQGFGSMVISRTVRHDLSGTCELMYTRAGLRALISLPFQNNFTAAPRQRHKPSPIKETI